jgi:alkyl sulfatase BDS1-like metallo-beta-lactamase superfamily hydrolase
VPSRPLNALLPLLGLALVGCSRVLPSAAGADGHGFSPATPITVAAQAEARAALPVDDGTDLAEAQRGLVAQEDSVRVARADGTIAFDGDAYRFLEGEAPPTVNPSLWRQAKLNRLHGLFRVTDGVYQLRGYDLAVMTLIESAHGWIVVDPLTSRETAGRALAFARKHMGIKPIVAVVFTHSHVDHFGGALAVASPEDVRAGKVRVIAPAGFLEEATSENVLAGPAMGRRAGFMYGRDLPRSERGLVDNGLGKEPAMGSIGILRPTELIDRTPQAMDVDGVSFVFQFTPGSEAPAELTFYLPEKKAFCGAEVLSRTLHNLYTLRGAKVRDASRWSAYIDEALDRFPESEVMFFSHHWPVWGRDRIALLMSEQRDTFRYIHDQTLRLANQGFGPRDIAERLRLPSSLTRHWWNRGYYGTLRHDVKAVYQLYFGWYEGNPATLDPLPRLEEARHTVAFMGGGASVLRQAEASFEAGEYRWVAQVLSHLVAAEPGNVGATALLARTYDQLGYVAESTAWRNVYLSGARELRHGRPARGMDLAATTDLLEQTAPEQFLQMFQVALNGPRAEDVALRIALDFRDVGETYLVTVENAVLRYRRTPSPEGANATVALTRALLVRLVTRSASLGELLTSLDLHVTGSALDVARFFGLLDSPDLVFPLVTPKE